MATLTGSIVYTDSDTQWARLHETDGVHRYEPDPAAEEAVCCLDNLNIEVPTHTYYHQVEPSGASKTRALLRRVAIALRTGVAFDVDAPATTDEAHPPEEDGSIIYKLRSSVPLKGFQRTDVSRLVLNFGRLVDVVPVHLALFLESLPQAEHGAMRPVEGSNGH